jgi:tripartite-type tricarboxylate transporter receptor subunit TctC
MRLCKRDLAALALLTTILPWYATASDRETVYPERPVTLVIGYPPGGASDALARLIAHYMGEGLGQRMIVDYKPGAAGNIGAESVARAAPDGYTIYLGGRPNTIHKAMYPHMKYDFSRDLVPLGLVATMPYVMVTHADAPIVTIQDLVRTAKMSPGTLRCASDGVASTAHLLCELLQRDLKIDLQHVPYRGGTPALTDVMGGRVDIQIAPVVATLPHIQAGKLRPIVMMSTLRVPAMPNVPTMGEAGVLEAGAGMAGNDLGAWYGLLAPTGTPPEVIAKLNRSINTALMDAALHEAMAQQAFVPPLQPNTPTAFKEMLAEETELWTGILRTHNIQPAH